VGGVATISLMLENPTTGTAPDTGSRPKIDPSRHERAKCPGCYGSARFTKPSSVQDIKLDGRLVGREGVKA
jgi:hypothetical protein